MKAPGSRRGWGPFKVNTSKGQLSLRADYIKSATEQKWRIPNPWTIWRLLAAKSSSIRLGLCLSATIHFWKLLLKGLQESIGKFHWLFSAMLQSGDNLYVRKTSRHPIIWRMPKGSKQRILASLQCIRYWISRPIRWPTLISR